MDLRIGICDDAPDWREKTRETVKHCTDQMAKRLSYLTRLRSAWNAGLPLPDIHLHTDPVILCKTKICNPYLTAYSFLLRINALYRSFLYSKFITCMHVFTSCFSCKKLTKLSFFSCFIRNLFGQTAQIIIAVPYTNFPR